MDKCFHTLLMSNQSLLQKKLYAGIRETGLSPGQPKILEYLYHNDGSSQKDVAHGCQVEPATVTNLLLRMEEAKLIRRCMEKGNRRSLYVYLTEDGRKAARIVEQTFEKLEEEAFAGFNADERERFVELFARIHENLSPAAE